MTENINEILNTRATTHGNFGVNATMSQDLKSTIEYYAEQTTTKLTKPQKEALDMICSKIARICVGNPNEIDHWRDIAGYALLVVKELESENNERKI